MRRRKPDNEIEVCAHVAYIKVISRSRSYLVAIDSEDVGKVTGYRWKLVHNKDTAYAVSIRRLAGIYISTYLHRLIVGVTESTLDVDHRDHDGLNNRKSNLRLTTRAVNNFNRRGPNSNNTSGYRGVTLDKVSGLYLAQINLKGRHLSLGKFVSKEDANKVVCDAREKVYVD